MGEDTADVMGNRTVTSAGFRESSCRQDCRGLLCPLIARTARRAVTEDARRVIRYAPD